MSSIEQRITQAEANQKQIIDMVKKLLTANNTTVAKVKDLDARVTAGEKLDAQQQAAIDGLKQIGTNITQAEQAATKAAEVTKTP
jgi:uncharacterized coiled-coil protein SlyX